MKCKNLVVDINYQDLEKVSKLFGSLIPKPKYCSIVDSKDPFNDGSLIAKYQFNGNANDLLGKHNGIWEGTEAYEEGKFGKCAKFDGSSSIEITNKEIDDVFHSGNFSISCFTNQYELNDKNTIIGWRDSDNYYGFVLQLRNGKIHYDSVKNNGASYGFIDTTKVLSNNKFHHICLVGNKTSISVTVDGIKQKNDIHLPDYSPNCTIFIGQESTRSDCKYYFNGSIEQFEIYNRALNEDEIKCLYAQEVLCDSLNKPSTNPCFNVVESFNNLTEKVYSVNNKKYMVGNGSINLSCQDTNNHDIEFNIGSFASIDRDIDSTNHRDYILISTDKGDIKIESPSAYKEDVDNYTRVLSNSTGYKVTLNSYSYYKGKNLPGQKINYDGTSLVKIKLYEVRGNIKVTFHSDESYENEAFGYEEGSCKICKHTY